MPIDPRSPQQRVLGVPAIEHILRDRISRAGSISFSEFMEIALYSQQHGYYIRHGPGRDYKTAPQTSPAFGHLLARAFARLHDVIGRSDGFDIVEVGAGTGVLATTIIDYLMAEIPGVATALRYQAIDQRQRPIEAHPALQWRTSNALNELTSNAAAICGVIFSNELFDAFPVHRIIGTAGNPVEMWVSLEHDCFVSTPGPIADVRSLTLLNAAGIDLEVGQIADVAPEAPEVYRLMCRSLARGIVVTIDYGGEATEVYGPRRGAGTLVSYFYHSASDNPLDRPGNQDLTAHVDFTALRKAGEDEGLTTVIECDQRSFLLGLGLQTWVESLDPRHLTVADHFNARAGASELIRLDGMGRFRVLVQARDVEREMIRTILGA